MPSPIMHLKHAEMLRGETRLPLEIREAIAAEMPTMRLGSIFPDMPFYTSIIGMTVGYWLERPAENCPIAQRMHSDNPDLFAWHLIEAMAEERALRPTQRLALLAGFFSHVGLDLEVHGLVNWCARRDVNIYGGHESHHHRLAEKYQSLFFHVDTEGRDCLGRRSFFAERAQILDEPMLRLRTELPIVSFISRTLAFYHGDAPRPRQVASWLRTFRQFAFLVSLKAAERNGNRLGTPENRERYYENDAFSFRDYFDRGYERTLQLIDLAYDMLRDPNRARRKAEFLSRAQISDLAYPQQWGLPALPSTELFAPQLAAA